VGVEVEEDGALVEIGTGKISFWTCDRWEG
jgi:hypothetical protein